MEMKISVGWYLKLRSRGTNNNARYEYYSEATIIINTVSSDNFLPFFAIKTFIMNNNTCILIFPTRQLPNRNKRKSKILCEQK